MNPYKFSTVGIADSGYYYLLYILNQAQFPGSSYIGCI